jgi:hypothetical protein
MLATRYRPDNDDQKVIKSTPDRDNDVVSSGSEDNIDPKQLDGNQQEHLTRFKTEMENLRLDDGFITSILQLATVYLISLSCYITGGVIIPLSYMIFDQFVQVYRNVIRYRTFRHGKNNNDLTHSHNDSAFVQ